MFEIRKTSAFGPISQRCQTSSPLFTVLYWYTVEGESVKILP